MDNTGMPSTARACNSNSVKFWVPAKVTIPVSCGRGDNSEKYTVPSLSAVGFWMKNSTPQMPAPRSEAVTDSAMRWASSSRWDAIGMGCQLSW